jgi:phage terminase small subunit
MSGKTLTARQRKFVELYNGNGTEAARQAGYKGTDVTLANVARNLLRKTEIARLINERQAKVIKKRIASREERQAFWTDVMEDAGEEMGARLKASELLAKSQADFIQKVEHSGPDGKPIAFTDHEAAAKLAAILNAARERKGEA